MSRTARKRVPIREEQLPAMIEGLATHTVAVGPSADVKRDVIETWTKAVVGGARKRGGLFNDD